MLVVISSKSAVVIPPTEIKYMNFQGSDNTPSSTSSYPGGLTLTLK